MLQLKSTVHDITETLKSHDWLNRPARPLRRITMMRNKDYGLYGRIDRSDELRF